MDSQRGLFLSSGMNPELDDLLEQLGNRLQTGEHLDLEAIIRQHPQHAHELRHYFPTLEVLAGLKHAPEPLAGLGELGDFQLLCEVGRGGMGIVYEAEQISLRRHVALKVLPFAATMAPRHLQRFHNEARAAASLDHPHIVKVHAVGCERGVHFYAMQFIDGQSLEAFLRRLRQEATASRRGERERSTDEPISLASGTTVMEMRTKAITQPAPGPASFRRVAEWGIAAAEALEHAHSMGIVHRDIKPANLLIDGQGRLWITDFGLARTTSDPGLTLTGDVLGTLRYMSPEQALAKHGLVGHRTDVYSLGVTLYELLTLHPAIEGEDREEILKKIALEEPVTPRQRNRSIPRELETIILKAMEKNLSDRYATAGEMADDLRRFLEDKPIQARRPTWTQRLRKWERRHRAAVATGIVAFVLLLIGAVAALTISNVRITQEKFEKDQALQQADRQRLIAEASFQRALALLHNAPLKRQLQWARDQVWNERFQYQTQEKALAVFRRLVTEPGPDAGDRMLTAEVHRELADIYRALGPERGTEGIQEYQKAIALLRPLAVEFPHEAGFRDSLAHCLKEKANLLARLRRQQADERNPRPLEDFSKDYLEAVALYDGLRQEFQDMPWYRAQLAECWEDLGGGYKTNGLFQQAEQAIRHALVLRRSLAKDFPQSTPQRDNIAFCSSQLAWSMSIRPDWNAQSAAAALEHVQQALELIPDKHDFWHTKGVVHCRLGHWKEALQCIEKSRQLEKEEFGYRPKPPDSFDRFFESMAYSGLGDKANARRCYDEAVQWMEKTLPNHADLRRLRTEAADSLQQLERKSQPQGPVDPKKPK